MSIRCTVFASLFALVSCSTDDSVERERADEPRDSQPLSFHAACKPPVEIVGEDGENDFRGRLVVDGSSFVLGREFPDDLETSEFRVVASEEMEFATAIYYASANPEEGDAAGTLVLGPKDRKAVQSKKNGKKFRVFESTTRIVADDASMTQMAWSCELADCGVLGKEFDECLGEHAQGCIDIFDTEIFACCDRSEDQPAACADIQALLDG
jgi:hypothetical protein